MKITMDAMIGIGLIIFSMIIYSMTGRLPEESASFPKVIAMIVGLLSVLLIVISLSKRNQEAKRTGFVLNLDVLKGLGIVSAYIFLINKIGFFVTTSVFVVMFMWIFRERSIKKILIAAVLLNLFIYLIFVMQLNVPLPKGIIY